MDSSRGSGLSGRVPSFIKGSLADARNLKRVLDVYCEASGQAINLGKSSMYFNVGAEEDTIRQITTILGVGRVDNPDLYLGLPTVWGRSKRDAMNFIKDRIREKMNGWRNNLLNNAGREVLIKAVVTSIPTYAMSIFQLPKTWCAEINAMIARFWWGSKEGERKIHWKRWQSMTLAKKVGGFGFKELTTFNVALLANMAARVLHEPNALWVQVLKGIYFPRSDFMQALKGGRASWGWSSLLAGRDVIKADGVWAIGDGLSVHTFLDRWVTTTPSLRLLPPPLQQASSWVPSSSVQVHPWVPSQVELARSSSLGTTSSSGTLARQLPVHTSLPLHGPTLLPGDSGDGVLTLRQGLGSSMHEVARDSDWPN